MCLNEEQLKIYTAIVFINQKEVFQHSNVSIALTFADQLQNSSTKVFSFYVSTFSEISCKHYDSFREMFQTPSKAKAFQQNHRISNDLRPFKTQGTCDYTIYKVTAFKCCSNKTYHCNGQLAEQPFPLILIFVFYIHQ